MKKILKRLGVLAVALLVALSAVSFSVLADEAAAISLSHSGAVRPGKVVTVSSTVPSSAVTAELSFDGTVISSAVTSGSAIRYLVPHGTDSGEHTFKLVTDKGLPTEATVSKAVTVYAHGVPANEVTIDFEDYTGTIAEDSAGCASGGENVAALEKSIGWLRGINRGNTAGVREIDGNKVLSLYTTADVYYTSEYIMVNAVENADKTYTNITSGKAYIEFDVDFYSNWRRGIVLTAFDSSNTSLVEAIAIISQKGINSSQGTAPANGDCSCHVSMVFDLDNKVVNGSVTMKDSAGKNVTETLKETAFPETFKNLSFYRIGVGSHKNQWINFDNIKTSYVETPLLKSASYTKGDSTYVADKAISCDSQSLEIAVNKDLASIDGKVNLKVNGESKAVSAVYADSVISIPVSGLKYGDDVEVTVSEDTLLADGVTTADEQIYLSYKVGNENGELYEENTSLDFAYNGNLRPGKVLTVTPTLPDGITTAQMYFDDTLISDSVVSASAIRYLVPDGTKAGEHTVSLVINSSMASEATVSEAVMVYGKDEATGNVTIDFEDYTGTIAEDQAGCATGGDNVAVLEKSIGWLRGINHGNTAGVREIDGNKVLSIYTTSTSGSYYNAYIMANAVENADKTYTNVTSGKAFIEFDVDFNSTWRRGVMVAPYDSSNKSLGVVEAISNQRGINSPEGTVPADGKCSCHVKIVFDFDNKVAGGSITMTDSTGKTVTETLNETALPEDMKNISFYRVGVGTHENNWINYDNIKTGYIESGMLKGVSYTKAETSFRTDNMIASDAESVKLAMHKELASIDGMVSLKVNGEAKAVSAAYADGVITVPVSALGLVRGDTVEIILSENTLLADGVTMADEQTKVSLTVGDANGSRIIVKDGRAVADYAITSESAEKLSSYIAVYNGNKLVALTCAKIPVVAGSRSYTAVSAALPDTYTAIKAMAWSSVKPVISDLEYTDK